MPLEGWDPLLAVPTREGGQRLGMSCLGWHSLQDRHGESRAVSWL